MAVKYEPVVTLGNLLTALTIACGGAAAWTSQSREIERVSVRADAIVEVNARQDSEIREYRGEVRSSIRDLQLDIKELSNKLGLQAMNQAAFGIRK